MDISYISLLCLLLTIGLYVAFRHYYLKYKYGWLMPLIPCSVLLIAFLSVTGISFETYYQYNHLLVWLLGPVMVAYAVPFYEFRHLIKNHYIALLGGTIASIIVSLALGLLLTRMVGLDPWVQKSFLLRSISTPFAFAAADTIGADKSLSLVFIVIMGIFSNTTGLLLFYIFRIRSMVAQGITFGNIGHGTATAKAFEISPDHGVLSSLSLILAGMITMLMAPLFLLFF